MKTIFITIFQGAEAKNILRTDIYKTLIAREDVRIVFFVDTEERAAYYQKEFSHPRVLYEVVGEPATGGLDAFFSSLSFLLLRTSTTSLRRKMTREESGNLFRYGVSMAANFLLARPWIRKMARALDYRLVTSDTFAPYFEKYRPDAILLAHMFDDQEVRLLREARHLGIPSIGFVNSWDKLTARRALRLLPDSMIVFNGIVKREAMRYADMAEKNIFVSGIPQYDWHVNYQPASREAFCKKNGLDLAKKIIVYAPMGKAFSNSDWDIIDLLNSSIMQNSKLNAQFFVRFQPNDFADEQELRARPWLRYALPGVRFSRERGVNWDMTFDDIRGLTDTLANADLFICYASSMSVDAAVFDKPVINIDFEVSPHTTTSASFLNRIRRSFGVGVKEKELMSKSPTFFYRTEHYGNVVRSGAIRYPKSKEELIATVRQYLERPETDRDARKRLVEAQCGMMDGHAGRRIAEYILNRIWNI